MSDDTDRDDAPQFTADTGMPIARAKWLMVRDGVVKRIKHSYDFLRHPFGDDAKEAHLSAADGTEIHVPRVGLAVFPATGAPASVGDLVDQKGNVTPVEGRTEPLLAGQPAYHSGPGVPPLPTSVVVANAPVRGIVPANKVNQTPAETDERKPDASVEHKEPEDADDKPSDHAEAHSADALTGFAALDAQAHD